MAAAVGASPEDPGGRRRLGRRARPGAGQAGPGWMAARAVTGRERVLAARRDAWSALADERGVRLELEAEPAVALATPDGSSRCSTTC